MKRLRQQQIRDLIGTRTSHAARARRRAERAGLPRDPGDGQPRRDRDGPHQVRRAKATRALRSPAARRSSPRPAGDERLALILRDLPIDIRPAGLLLVVRAVPGPAHAIAAALDRTGWPEVAGSIAGDDTVFIACSDRKALDRVRARLVQLASLNAG